MQTSLSGTRLPSRDFTHKTSDSLWGAFAVFGIVALAMASLSAFVLLPAILHGYVISVLWSWFMVPAFSVPKISIPMAIGLVLLFRGLVYRVDTSDQKLFPKKPKAKGEEQKGQEQEEEKPPKELLRFYSLALTVRETPFKSLICGMVMIFTPPLFTLLAGWILHRWFL
jgi:hypothetical protein